MVAQKALNVINHVAQKTSELEMALQLAEIRNGPGFQDEHGWKELAVRSMPSPAAVTLQPYWTSLWSLEAGRMRQKSDSCTMLPPNLDAIELWATAFGQQ